MRKSKKLPDNEITVYQTPDGNINIEVLYANENIWLSQKRMAELFDCTPDNVSLHLKNIYREQELTEAATAEEFSVVQKEGGRTVTRRIMCYSLSPLVSEQQWHEAQRTALSADGFLTMSFPFPDLLKSHGKYSSTARISRSSNPRNSAGPSQRKVAGWKRCTGKIFLLK